MKSSEGTWMLCDVLDGLVLVLVLSLDTPSLVGNNLGK